MSEKKNSDKLEESAPTMRSYEEKPLRVIITNVEDDANENYQLKKQSSITYNISKTLSNA